MRGREQRRVALVEGLEEGGVGEEKGTLEEGCVREVVGEASEGIKLVEEEAEEREAMAVEGEGPVESQTHDLEFLGEASWEGEERGEELVEEPLEGRLVGILYNTLKAATEVRRVEGENALEEGIGEEGVEKGSLVKDEEVVEGRELAGVLGVEGGACLHKHAGDLEIAALGGLV